MACSLDYVLDEALVVRKQSVGCRDTEIGKLATTTASPGRPAVKRNGRPLNQENYQDLDIGKYQKRTMTALIILVGNTYLPRQISHYPVLCARVFYSRLQNTMYP
jgi:hypothetical protein